MKRLWLIFGGVTLVASTAAFASMGGWAVVSVSKIPDAWITGKPLQLTWKVRQHGVKELDGLRPTLEARSGSHLIRGTTWAFEEDGERGYRGTITFPNRGEWQVTIHSGFGKSRAVLLPWPVVDSVTPIRGTVEEYLKTLGIAPLSEAERGRRMFVSIGCVTCHVHRAVAVSGEVNRVGPDLTDRRFAADYLARFLKDPSVKPPANGKRMPSPGLRDKDIAPLVAFINAQPLTARH
jgi:hypothetical protein